MERVRQATDECDGRDTDEEAGSGARAVAGAGAAGAVEHEIAAQEVARSASFRDCDEGPDVERSPAMTVVLKSVLPDVPGDL